MNDYPALNNMIVVTITNIENHILQNCSKPIYSIDIIYSKKMLNYNNKPEEQGSKRIRPDLNVKLNYALDIIIFSSKYTDNLYHQILHDKFFPDSDKQIKMNWYGNKLYGYEVLRYVSKKVIDINDVVNFQWFAMKLFVVKILVKIHHALEFFNRHASNGKLNINSLIVLNKKINEFKILNFPKSLKASVSGTIDTVLCMIDEGSVILNFKNMYHKCNKLIIQNIEFLDGHPDQVLNSSVENILEALSTDINNYKELLNELSKESRYFTFLQSSQWSSFSEKIFSDDTNIPMELD